MRDENNTPPPRETSGAIAGAFLPKKKPWSKPTILTSDGTLEVVKSGATVTGIEKDIQYRIS